MSKKINESLSKEFRLGQVGVNNQDLKMTIIAYRKANDLDVQFEDGTIVKNRQYDHFLKGKIAYPSEKRIGETKKNNQDLIMTIIAYRGCMDIDVQFEDGTIVKNKRYDSFLKGAITNHNYKDSRIIDRTSETNINNQELQMTIIAYRGCEDIDVQFEDGTIVKNKRYDSFLNGAIAYPMENRIGEIKINNQGLKMTIINYRDCNDIDVQFEDGTIVENRAYGSFLKGAIANPNVLLDGISIPEKFMWNVLKELNIEFKTQLNKKDFDWCQNYKYDFYIPSLNMVVETHGGQHYERGFESCNGKTLKKEQENDRLKKELALNNNIKNYVVVDCRKSELEWLKENTIKELDRYFNLSNIDWGLVWNNSLKNLVYEVKRLVEEGYNNKQIAEILDINEKTVRNYKKQLGIKTRNEIKQENLLRTKELVQQGKSTKEIAEILGITVTTVNVYKRELKEKGLI